MRAAVLDVNVYLDFPRTRVLDRGGSPEPPKAIAVNRPYLAAPHAHHLKALTLSADFVFDTRS